MSNDYLWDGSGTPDPDVQRLEALLGRLRSTPPPLDFARGGPELVEGPVPQLPDMPLRWRTLRYLAPMLAAAAVVAVMVGLTARSVRRSPFLDVAITKGRPRIGSTPVAGGGRMAVGQMLVTDGSSQARVNVSTIGYVDIDPNTQVRLVETRDGRHQLSLARGTLRAVITAPPGQFIVDTPSGTATDLGCAYTLHVDEDGAGLLSVTAGWVALERNGRESFVPAGASCRTHPNLGPGTPRFDDASREIQEALDEFDFGPDASHRADALRFILEHRDSADTVTLWHLVPRVEPAARGAVVDALADQVAMPPGVTRDAILRLDRAALDLWWSEQGLGSAAWWRKWKNW